MWNALKNKNTALSRLTWAAVVALMTADGVRAEEQAGRSDAWVASTGLSTWQCTHRTHHQAPARPGSLPFITYITASLVSSQMPWPLTSIFRLANETGERRTTASASWAAGGTSMPRERYFI